MSDFTTFSKIPLKTTFFWQKCPERREGASLPGGNIAQNTEHTTEPRPHGGHWSSGTQRAHSTAQQGMEQRSGKGRKEAT